MVGDDSQRGPQSRSFPTALVVLGGVGILGIALLIYFVANSQSRSGSSNLSSSSPTPVPSMKSTPDVSFSQPSPSQSNVNLAPPVITTPRLDDQFRHDYEGHINRSIRLTVTLVRSGRALEGSARTSSSMDQLSGTIDADGSFKLDGYENGQVRTGIYTGQIRTDGTITGNWTTVDGRKRTPFFLRQE